MEQTAYIDNKPFAIEAGETYFSLSAGTHRA
jgi:hypothetical protein